jgi:hypothetical protein
MQGGALPLYHVLRSMVQKVTKGFRVTPDGLRNTLVRAAAPAGAGLTVSDALLKPACLIRLVVVRPMRRSAGTRFQCEIQSFVSMRLARH